MIKYVFSSTNTVAQISRLQKNVYRRRLSVKMMFKNINIKEKLLTLYEMPK